MELVSQATGMSGLRHIKLPQTASNKDSRPATWLVRPGPHWREMLGQWQARCPAVASVYTGMAFRAGAYLMDPNSRSSSCRVTKVL